MKQIITTLSLTLLSACSMADRAEDVIGRRVDDGVFVVTDEFATGGNVAQHAHFAEYLMRNNIKTEVRTRLCRSSCIYFLMPQDVCTDPRTIYELHSVRHIAATIVWAPIAWERGNRVVAYDLNNRWPGLGDDFLEYAANKHGNFVWKLTGEQMHNRYGVPLCDD